MSVELSGIVKRYGDHTALDGVSLTVGDGAFVSLLGPSGCGKTTLLNAIAVLIPVDGGEVSVDGERWSTPGYTLPPEARHIGMVFQDLALWPHMNVFDNIAFGLNLRRVPAKEVRERVGDVLATVDLAPYAQSMVHHLSGGQRQRVAIARALVLAPRLILMDEPLSALDAKLRERMRWELRELMHRAAMTTVYVTHDQAEALSMSDHVVLLNQGRVVQAGPPEALYQEPATPFAAEFLGASNLLRAVVETVSDHRARLRWHGQPLWAERGQAAPIGAEVPVMVRPHSLLLSRMDEREVGDGPVASWPARIESRTFLGAHWSYRVSLMESGECLEVAAPRRFEVGETVVVLCPEGAAVVLTDDGVDTGAPAADRPAPSAQAL